MSRSFRSTNRGNKKDKRAKSPFDDGGTHKSKGRRRKKRKGEIPLGDSKTELADILVRIQSSDNTLTVQGIEEFNKMSFKFSSEPRFINIAFDYKTVLEMSDDEVSCMLRLLERGIFSRLYVLCFDVAKVRSNFRRIIRRSTKKKAILNHVLYAFPGEKKLGYTDRVIKGFGINNYISSHKEDIVDLITWKDSQAKAFNLPVFYWGVTEDTLGAFKAFITKHNPKGFPKLYDKHEDAEHMIDTDASSPYDEFSELAEIYPMKGSYSQPPLLPYKQPPLRIGISGGA